ncbi:MAG TPA: hypothetical protein VGO71_07705 [Baekduia sp.]|nr:hypothetical protein [Baekduia sp.]
MTDPALIPAALYGLRTWRAAADERGERLVGAYDDTPWPDHGAWLEAVCGDSETGDHAAPGAECRCGIHAWHPDRRAARRVLASRRDVAGIVEATGAIEIHEEGFRAQRARPHALVVVPGRNRAMLARLAERYDAELVEVSGPDALAAWCRERGLGLPEQVVDQLLGIDRAAARRRRRRRDARGVAALLAIVAVMLSLGFAFVNGPPGPNGVYGRTGWVILPAKDCPRTAPARSAGSRAPASRSAAPASPARETNRPGGGRCP